MQNELTQQLTWLSREVHRYVPDFHIVHVSGWQTMTSLPPVYRPRLLASSIGMALCTTTFIRGVCIYHALVKTTSSSYIGRSKKSGHDEDMRALRGSCMETELLNQGSSM